MFVPEFLFLVSLWLANAALRDVKVQEGFRCPPDYPKKRPFWFPRRRFCIERSRGTGTIYEGYDLKNLTQVWKSAKDDLTHELGLGGTGAGKTVKILGKIFAYLINGSGVFLNDAKGVNELYFQVLTLMRRLGCVEDLALINYLENDDEEPLAKTAYNTRISNTIELLREGTPEVLRTLLTGMLRNSGGENSDFWKSKASALLYAVLVAIKDKERRRLLDINLETIRSFTNEEIFSFLYFDSEIDDRTQGLIKSYLSDAPSFTIELAKTYLFNACIDLIDEHSDVGDVHEILWNRFRIKLNKIGSKTVEPLVGASPGSTKKLETPAEGPVFREQWGYLTMQLTETFQVMMFEYEHIFNSKFIPTGEVNVPQMMLDRKVILQFMPTLTREQSSNDMLAKLMMGTLRPLFAKGISAKVQGHRKLIFDNLPTNARFPCLICLDEYPQYGAAADGMGAAAALVRQMNFALCFAGQQITLLAEKNKAEWAHVEGNTTTKWSGYLEESKTIEWFVKRGDKALVARTDGFEEIEHKPGQFRRSRAQKIVEEDRIKAKAVSSFNPGEGYMIRKKTIIHMHFFGVLFDEGKDYTLTDYSSLNCFIALPRIQEKSLKAVKQQIKANKSLHLISKAPKLPRETPIVASDFEYLIGLYQQNPTASTVIPAIIACSSQEQLSDRLASCQQKIKQSSSKSEVSAEPFQVESQYEQSELSFEEPVNKDVSKQPDSFDQIQRTADFISGNVATSKEEMFKRLLMIENEQRQGSEQVGEAIRSLNDTDDLIDSVKDVIIEADNSIGFNSDVRAFNCELEYLDEFNESVVNSSEKISRCIDDLWKDENVEVMKVEISD